MAGVLLGSLDDMGLQSRNECRECRNDPTASAGSSSVSAGAAPVDLFFLRNGKQRTSLRFLRKQERRVLPCIS
jgi:hypothetical protein